MEGGRFQSGALALAPRTFVFKVCRSYTDGGRPFSKWGSRLGAAQIRLKIYEGALPDRISQVRRQRARRGQMRKNDLSSHKPFVKSIK